MARIGDGGDPPQGSFCGKSQKQGKKLLAPVAAGMAPGGDAEHRRLDGLIPEQQHDPVYRPHEFLFAIAPAHALGTRKLRQCAFHDAGNELDGGMALFPAAVSTRLNTRRSSLDRSRVTKPDWMSRESS